jgi:hypothetical protein
MTAKNNDDGVLDWDELSRPDQIRAEQLLRELHQLFRKYENRTEEDSCEDSTLTD